MGKTVETWTCCFIFGLFSFLICEAAGDCSHGGWECATGECVLRENVCNSVADCSDGSDESRCDRETCEDFLFQCRDKTQCVSRVGVCNGRPECGDGSDEDQPDCDREDFVAVDNSHQQSSSSVKNIHYFMLIIVILVQLSYAK